MGGKKKRVYHFWYYHKLILCYHQMSGIFIYPKSIHNAFISEEFVGFLVIENNINLVQGIDSIKLTVHKHTNIGRVLPYSNKLYNIYENVVTILATMKIH